MPGARFSLTNICGVVIRCLDIATLSGSEWGISVGGSSVGSAGSRTFDLPPAANDARLVQTPNRPGPSASKLERVNL